MTDAPQPPLKDEGASVPWWLIGCGALALAIFVVVGVVLFPVVAAIVFPPLPPVPVGVTVVETESTAYGFDTWTYELTGDVCSVTSFYQNADGNCVVEPGHCDDDQRRSALAATCNGEQQFSRFLMRWEAEVWNYPDHIDLHLSREIAWTR